MSFLHLTTSAPTEQAPSLATLTSITRNRTSLSSIDRDQKTRHKVQALADADRYWAAGRHDECAQKCYEVLRAEPSDAIRGRAHMYLATVEVGPEYAQGRAWHAQTAMDAWHMVINRTGSSKFPIEKAEVQLALTRQLLQYAEESSEVETPPPADTPVASSPELGSPAKA